MTRQRYDTLDAQSNVLQTCFLTRSLAFHLSNVLFVKIMAGKRRKKRLDAVAKYPKQSTPRRSHRVSSDPSATSAQLKILPIDPDREVILIGEGKHG